MLQDDMRGLLRECFVPYMCIELVRCGHAAKSNRDMGCQYDSLMLMALLLFPLLSTLYPLASNDGPRHRNTFKRTCAGRSTWGGV